MRKKGFLFGIMLMFLGTFFYWSQDVQANIIEGQGETIPTNCVCVISGKIIGYANDCGTGLNTCFDTECVESSNQC